MPQRKNPRGLWDDYFLNSFEKHTGGKKGPRIVVGIDQAKEGADFSHVTVEGILDERTKGSRNWQKIFDEDQRRMMGDDIAAVYAAIAGQEQTRGESIIELEIGPDGVYDRKDRGQNAR